MIAVPAIRRDNQARAMVLGYVAFSVVYVGSGTFHLAAPTTLQPGALDAAVPALDWTVWIYLTQFLLLPTGIMLARDDADRSRTFYAMLVATAVAALVFLAWPTQIARGTPPMQGVTGFAWQVLYLTDTPANCFPSLHVALAAIAARALWRRGAQLVATAWPLAIFVSTLTTRQHVALDIAGGLALAAVALWMTPRVLRLDATPATARAAEPST